MDLSFLSKVASAAGKPVAGTHFRMKRYDYPEAVLDLVTHILQGEHFVAERYFEEFYAYLSEVHNNAEFKQTKELISNIWERARTLEEMLLSGGDENLKIAVAGGFSSGKSSFLNAILSIGDKLPTGIDPVSIVNTQLCCSRQTESLRVYGRNKVSSADTGRGGLVRLDEEVLDYIRHSSASQVHLSKALESIVLDVPVKGLPYLDGITFIDTPGYNNAQGGGKQKSDSATALAGIEEAAIVFWCIDIEAGTINSGDLDYLKGVEQRGQHYGIIFTKSDKKSSKEIPKILRAAEELCRKQLKSKPLFVVAFTREDNALCDAQNKYKAVHHLIEQCRKEHKVDGFLATVEQELRGSVASLIAEAEEAQQDARKEFEQLVKKSAEQYKELRKAKQSETDIMELVEGLLTARIPLLQIEYSRAIGLAKVLLAEYRAADNRQASWERESGMFSSTSGLLEEQKKANLRVDKALDKWDNEAKDFESWNDKDLSDLVTYYIRPWYESYNERFDNREESLEEDKEYWRGHIKSLEKELRTLEELQKKGVQLLHRAYKLAHDGLEQYKSRLNKISDKPISMGDFFEAIRLQDKPQVLAYASQAKGVDLKLCNSEGYHALTWAWRTGALDVLRMFMEAGADADCLDKRGESLRQMIEQGGVGPLLKYFSIS